MIERMNSRENEPDVTTAKARLPGLDIDVTHQRGPSGEWEQISIIARATPSFESFERSFEAANPFKLWAQTARLMWMPWLLVANPMTLLGKSHEAP